MKKSIFKSRKEAALLIISFFIALAFFIYQKRFSSWDFSVYVMNAEYVLKGFYFEWLRAPLVSWIILPFLKFGRQTAIYSFTILTTIIYFLSIKLFHDKFLKKYNNSEVFYLLAISPFILGFGLAVGSELLSLSLIIFFLVFFSSYPSFIFLGLAMLTRYSNLFLFPLVFFQKNIKKIILGLIILVVVFLPWFFINYQGTGHALTSLGDYYALNSLEQAKPVLGLDGLLSSFLMIINFLIPFFIIGIIVTIKNWKDVKEKTLVVLLSALFILTVLTYLFNSLKDLRYLFNISLPAIYFSFIGINFILDKIKNKKIFSIVKIALVLFLLLTSLAPFQLVGESRVVEKINNDLTPKLKDLNNCTVSSNLWVFFDWNGIKARHAPSRLILQENERPEIFKMSEEGYNIILFKGFDGYKENEKVIDQLNTTIIENNEVYIWLKNNSACKQTERINATYIDSLKPFGEFSSNFTGCDALLLRLKLTNICRIFPFL